MMGARHLVGSYQRSIDNGDWVKEMDMIREGGHLNVLYSHLWGMLQLTYIGVDWHHLFQEPLQDLPFYFFFNF